jgi:hypothetical protein
MTYIGQISQMAWQIRLLGDLNQPLLLRHKSTRHRTEGIHIGEDRTEDWRIRILLLREPEVFVPIGTLAQSPVNGGTIFSFAA